MRALLSTIGSRGDVQPVVALALHLKSRGHEARVCVPPDFREWIEGLGIEVVPVGPAVRGFAAARASAAPASAPAPLTAEQRRQMMEATIVTQFETLGAAAEDCNVIVAATALQVGARSIAEKLGIPYVFAAYAPIVIPSRHHAPPPLPPIPGQTPVKADDTEALWAENGARFNDLFLEGVNRQRTLLGLEEIEDMRRHMMTDQPWLAADATLGPWPEPEGAQVLQTGAWMMPDERPLPDEVVRFLDAGAPPIYFGFGSTKAAPETGPVMLAAARALGRRAIVSQGWFDEALIENAPDCLSIGEANFNALFPRVAVVVHHGGAGTTAAAAMAGVAQVVAPKMYDQHYWSRRVESLGIGTTHPAAVMSAESLGVALERSLSPEVGERARTVAAVVSRDGTRVATDRLLSLV